MGKSIDLPQNGITSVTVGDHANHLAIGTMQGFVASAISLPTGLLTAAFLTRQLGPVDYGLLTVAATIVVWIETTITVGFSRTVVKFVAETTDWQSVSTRFLQAQLLVSLGATALLIAAAPVLASWLGAAEMSTYLRIYSLGIPITALGATHQSILIGRGHFGRRAILPAAYWLSRMVLVFLFVGLRPSVTNVILANIGASVVVLTWARRFVSPALLAYSNFPLRNLWDYAWPLFFYTVGLNLFNGLDLLFVKAIGGIPQAAGFYGAAKNLTIVPALFAASFSPLLLAKLSSLQSKDNGEAAQIMTKQAMRLVFCLLPFAGMAAGAASEVVTAIYGGPFLPAAPFLALLIFAALAVAMMTVTTSTLIAAGRPGLPIILTGPFVAMAPLAHFTLVSWFGPIGAAATTTGLAWLGAGTCMLSVQRIWHVLPSLGTLIRCVSVCAFAYALAVFWSAPGVLLLIKLPAIGLIIILAFLLFGEFSAKEIGFARSVLSRQTEMSKG
jgi:O-antigen/teichoic acid export membrane protein